MPPNTPRKPLEIEIVKETELSKDQLKSKLFFENYKFL
jgi:hypothetical protein